MPAGCPTTPHGDKKPVRPDKTAPRPPRHSQDPSRRRSVREEKVGRERRRGQGRGGRRARRDKYGGGAAAQPNADGGTACLAFIARTGAPRGAAPPHSVTIQALPIHVQVGICEDRAFVCCRTQAKHHRIRWGLRLEPSESVGTRVTGVPGQPKLDAGPEAGHLDSPRAKGPRRLLDSAFPSYPPRARWRSDEGPPPKAAGQQGGASRAARRRAGRREGETRARVQLLRPASAGPGRHQLSTAGQ